MPDNLVPPCPWCGDESVDKNDLPRDLYEVETVCEGCGQPITIHREEITTYTCSKREEE